MSEPLTVALRNGQTIMMFSTANIAWIFEMCKKIGMHEKKNRKQFGEYSNDYYLCIVLNQRHEYIKRFK